ncbi:MAG: methylglyoxal synthase [Ruminococcaceae bacterium]|nr:methylglyoxal synthase [Oscillospiraceae bacterium]
MTYKNQTFEERKRIALVAHDNMKPVLIRWCRDNKAVLKNHWLCGTGTTARLISDYTGLEVTGYMSGPLGGDQKIGTMIAEGELDMIIFFSDPLTAQPHDPDVKALIRIAQVYDIPVANNKATADYLITSPLFNSSYTAESPAFAAPSTGNIDVGR